jgi:serine/threonine protein kinase
MIDRKGCVKLLDFGSIPAATDGLVGTAAYLAPEIWQGHERSIESDLFSLGLLIKDAADGFANAPDTPEKCRERADKANEGKWLRTNPGERKLSRNLSDPEVIQTLAYLIHRELQTDEQTPQTQILMPSMRPTSGFRLVLSAILIFLFILSWPQKSDLRVQLPQLLPAQLQVHTQEWVALKLNGRALGYSPLWISSLRAGSHRLQWQRAKSYGEMRIELSSGQILRLSDRDFRPDPQNPAFIR